MTGGEAAAEAIGAAVHRPNAVTVDLDAITANVRALRREAGVHTKLFGAVKANGYGFGLPAVAEAIVEGGADGFGLSAPDDALRIRRAGIDAPILMYGGMPPGMETAAFARRWNLTLSVGELETAHALRGLPGGSTQVVVEVDVGLERLGAGVDQAAELVTAVSSLPGIRLMGVTTHLHGIGPPGYMAWQLGRFEAVIDTLLNKGLDPGLRLAESSATVGTGAHPRLNAIDPGHLLYGLLPAGRTDRPGWLQPALISITSRILQVKPVDRREFTAESPVAAQRPVRIGVIPMGTADGLRMLSCGEVLVRGRRCRLAGGLSLEHARIDLSDVPDAERGDEVVLVGRQGDEEISAADVIEANGLASAGLVVSAARSVQRIYRRSGA